MKKGDYTFQLDNNQIKISVESHQKTKVLNLLENNGIIIENFVTKEPSLEKAFIEYTSEDSSAGGEIQ